MNPLSEKQIERALRQSPGGADLDRALESFQERAQSDGLVDVAYAGVDSPFGKLILARTDHGVVQLALPTHRGTAMSEEQILERLAKLVSPRILESPRRLDEERRKLDEYFAGRRHDFDVLIDWSLTPKGFRNRALHAVARIPYGETRTYGDIAKQAGNARAFRAAGTACGTNPVPLFVPCHRVLQAGGKVGNYGGGPEMKRALLELEGARPPFRR